MSYTKNDKDFFEGYGAGYKRAIDDVRQELLTLPKQNNMFTPVDVFMILNNLIRERE